MTLEVLSYDFSEVMQGSDFTTGLLQYSHFSVLIIRHLFYIRKLHHIPAKDR
jgi:hypothetical protein